jgi:hypothetical protein
MPCDTHGFPETAGCPSLIAHVPRFDGSLQTAPPVHDEVEQQTPSTQLFELHAVDSVDEHVVPFASFAAQCFVASQ